MADDNWEQMGRCPVGKQCHPSDPHCIFPVCQRPAASANASESPADARDGSGSEQRERVATPKDAAASAMLAALEKAAKQFRFYEREHREKYEAYDARCDGPMPPKGRLKKAETNRRFAEMCEAEARAARSSGIKGM